MDLVFAEDGLDQIHVQLGLGTHGLQVQPPLLLSLEDDVGRCLVEPDSESLELLFNELLVLQRL